MALIDIHDSDLRLLAQTLTSAMHPAAPGSVLSPREYERANQLRARLQGMLDATNAKAAADRVQHERKADGFGPGITQEQLRAQIRPATNGGQARRTFWDGETVRHIDGREGVIRFAGHLGSPLPTDSHGNALPYLWVDFQDKRECVAVGYLEKIPQDRPPGVDADGHRWRTETPAPAPASEQR